MNHLHHSSIGLGRFLLGVLLLASGSVAVAVAAEEKAVSFYQDIVPVLKRSCTGCHHPGKLKGKLDLTTHSGFKKGGKEGPSFVPGHPEESLVIEEVSGEEPSMPDDGDPLSKSEVAMLARWIREGAKDDTPVDANSFLLSEAPTYRAPPVVSAMVFSPDGKRLAISGYHETVVLAGAKSNIVARLVGESPRIESIAFSPNGKLIAVAGGAPARFGEIQIWDASAAGTLIGPRQSFKVAPDSVFGVAWSPEGDRLSFGCADKSVRIIAVADGKELLKFDNHSDWVFATTWTMDGSRVLSGSRDRAMKLIDAQSGQFIDDINKLLEEIVCFDRHPNKNLIAYGGALGVTRIYRIQDNQKRTSANNDVNQVRVFERMSGPVQAIAYSPDGKQICVGSVGGEARLFNAEDGKRAATLTGHEGAIFSIVFDPNGKEIVTAGYEGVIRVFDGWGGKLVRSFLPVPITGEKSEPLQQAAR